MGMRCRVLLAMICTAIAAAASPELLASNATSGCPIQFQKITFEEVAAGQAKPFILGGPRLPTCTNCPAAKQALWSNFCAFRSSGPVCSPWLQQQLLDTFVARGMRELLELSPCDLWPLLAGRTTWLIGDSQTLDFFKAVACFMVEFWDLKFYPPTDDPEVIAIMSRVIHPMCILLPGGARVCFVRSDHGNQIYGELLPAFHKYGKPEDQMIINFGQHYHQTYEGNLTAFADYLDAHPPGGPGMPGAVLFQEMLQTHEPNGWPHVRWPCKPIEGVSITNDGRLVAAQPGKEVYLKGGPLGSVANRILVPRGVHMVRGSYNESVPMAGYHRWDPDGPGGSYQGQCIHYCFPAAPQTSTYAMYRALRDFRRRQHENAATE